MGPSHAHARPGHRLTERELRVQQVVDLMCTGQWLAGVSERLLSERWGCTRDNVRKVSAEASRVLRRRLREDPDAKAEARAQLLQNFEVIRAKCMNNGDAQSLRVALDAMRAYGFYLGIEPVKRLDVTTTHEDPFDGWSEAELDAYAKDGQRPRRAGWAARQLATERAADSEGEGGPVH